EVFCARHSFKITRRRIKIISGLRQIAHKVLRQIIYKVKHKNPAPGPTLQATSSSNQNSLHLIERDLIAAAIVKPGRARRLVRGHLLRDLQLSAALQIRRDPRGAERVATDESLDARARRAPADHEIHFRLRHAPLGELLRFAPRRPEEGSALLVLDASSFDVSGNIFFEVVMRRHLVALAALLMQPYPPAAILKIPILDIHARRRADAGERV